jgi:DNA modification methylase
MAALMMSVMMPTYSQHERFTLYHGDNREVLKGLADNSIDSIVTDPPYELGFMGKSWDASGIAFNVEVWQECLRVLKPGGHLLAFSGSRTYHRMVVAIEDAGFEVRDQIMWIYGSGFPKSLDVSKAIDKAAGAEREVVGNEQNFGVSKAADGKIAFGDYAGEWNVTNPATPAAKQWQGWGTALKPAHEPIVVARKPLIGTVAANVLTYGTGGLNIDGARVAGEVIETTNGNTNAIYGDLSANAGEIWTSHTQGRWPANVIHDGSDEVVELFPNTRARGNLGESLGGGGMYGHAVTTNDFGAGDSGSAARFFYCAKASKRDRNEGLEGFEVKTASEMVERKADSDGMKSPRAGAGRTSGAQNHHPTVKPTDLMRYLCRLVTPPNGTVFDPFMGSGSTGKAAMYEGFKFIGIEMTDEYLPIAKARIEFAIKEESERLKI